MNDYIAKGFTYEDYSALLDELVAKNLTTGPKQSETLSHFTKLNRQRMRRLDKTVTLLPEAVDAAASVRRRMIWLVITEGWCGDAAQNVPIIEKIARASRAIETRYVLRDENLELMDEHLTNGARSIPKLVALDAETHEVLGTWGARTAAAQSLYASLKSADAPKDEMMEALQRWYIEDHGVSIQREFVELIRLWSGLDDAAAAAV
jgi:hypothetical protein